MAAHATHLARSRNTAHHSTARESSRHRSVRGGLPRSVTTRDNTRAHTHTHTHTQAVLTDGLVPGSRRELQTVRSCGQAEDVGRVNLVHALQQQAWAHGSGGVQVVAVSNASTHEGMAGPTWPEGYPSSSEREEQATPTHTWGSTNWRAWSVPVIEFQTQMQRSCPPVITRRPLPSLVNATE